MFVSTSYCVLSGMQSLEGERWHFPDSFAPRGGRSMRLCLLRCICGNLERETDRDRDRQTNRHAETETKRQRQTDRQTDRHTHTHTHTQRERV